MAGDTSRAASSCVIGTLGEPAPAAVVTADVDSNASNESATGGVDYAKITRQAVTFAANESSKTFTVNTYQDALTEGTEGFYLLLFKNYADAFSDYAAFTYANIKDPAVTTNYTYTLTSNAASA